MERPKRLDGKSREKEDGHVKSQKILLTWLIEDEGIFNQIRRYITPDDFTGELYKKVAALLYEQYEGQDVNPARIMNHFTDEDRRYLSAQDFLQPYQCCAPSPGLWFLSAPFPVR